MATHVRHKTYTLDVSKNSGLAIVHDDEGNVVVSWSIYNNDISKIPAASDTSVYYCSKIKCSPKYVEETAKSVVHLNLSHSWGF